jgi:D-beta-D-heptose 7-phosphate kinase/D-beta-D-heptose 1-phosphate adenosyltransferase
MKIVVIGETCIDKFIYCEINRLSPEAPVPILQPMYTKQNAGMSGNTMANLKALSPEHKLLHFCNLSQVTKTRYVEKKTNHMFLRVDEGDDKIDPFEWSDDYVHFIKDADLVIVSDYNKGYLSDYDLEKIAFHSKISILDSKRKLTNHIIKHFDFVKLNEGEWRNNIELDDENIIITLGSKGSMYQGKLFPSPNPQETIDVSGAGDTFTAAFAINYLDTKSVTSSILFANEVSAKVVSKRGVVTP